MAGKKGKYYSEEFKRQVADEYMRGEGNMKELKLKYGIASFASVHMWIHKYGLKDLDTKTKTRITSKAATKSTYHKELFAKFMKGIKTGETPKFASDTEKALYLLLENQYLKKKLLDMGESKTFIANLWSSKNLKELLAQLGVADVWE